MADIKINKLSTDNQPAEMQQLSEENAKKVIGGVAFSSLALNPSQLLQAWCCCSGNLQFSL